MRASLFDVDPVTNEVIYQRLGSEVVGDESGVVSDTNSSEGSILDTETEVLETQENVLSDIGTGDSVMLLSEEVTETLLASSPASGSLNSSTIDYFDRLVDGLPSDYGYVAYRNSSDDAYAGSIIYGKDWDCNDNTIVFGEGATEIDVSRVTGTGYSSYISYDSSDASNSVITVNQSGSILYYTNALEGFPILGSGARPFDIAPFLVVGLISAFAVCVLNRLLNRRL